jgi:hypothetical protein
VAHSANDSETAIYEAANRFVLEVGAVLLERERQAPKGFDRWVEESCPFDIAQARTFMLAVIAQDRFGDAAPKPWTVLAI